MSCRRVCRELLWLARFGEFGPSSQPHLDHLAGCQHCRDEVGFDRALVQQLRVALAERVQDAAPSPDAFQAILARTRQPERRRWFVSWTTALGRLRFATAMAGTGLAVVLALNMEVVRVDVPDTGPARGGEAVLQQVPRMPPGHTTLVALGQHGDGRPAASRPDPEAALMWAATIPLAPAPAGGQEEPAEEPAEAPSVELRVAFRPFQIHDPGAGASAPDDPDDAGVEWAPVELSQGEPS